MGASEHPYHRAVAPMMWAFVALASIELVVVHFLLALWWPALAVALSLVTGASILWLVSVIRSFRRLPVAIDDGMLRMRVGSLKQVTTPLSNIVGLCDGFTAEQVKAKGTLNLALIAWPNVLVDLRQPVRVGRREVRAVAHRLDDPAGFAMALAEAASPPAR